MQDVFGAAAAQILVVATSRAKAHEKQLSHGLEPQPKTPREIDEVAGQLVSDTDRVSLGDCKNVREETNGGVGQIAERIDEEGLAETVEADAYAYRRDEQAPSDAVGSEEEYGQSTQEQ